MTTPSAPTDSSQNLARAQPCPSAAPEASEAATPFAKIPGLRNAFEPIPIDLGAQPPPANFFAAVKRQKRRHAFAALGAALASGSVLPLFCMLPKHILDAYPVANGIFLASAGLASIVFSLLILIQFATDLLKIFEAACFEAEIFINHKGILALAAKHPKFYAYEKLARAQGRPLTLEEAEAFCADAPRAIQQALAAKRPAPTLGALPGTAPASRPSQQAEQELREAKAMLAATQAKLAAAEIEIMHAGQYPAPEHHESRDGLAMAARLNESSRDVLAAVDQASRRLPEAPQD